MNINDIQKLSDCVQVTAGRAAVWRIKVCGRGRQAKSQRSAVQVISRSLTCRGRIVYVLLCAMGSGPSAAGPTTTTDCAKCKPEPWVCISSSRSSPPPLLYPHPVFLFQNHGRIEGAHIHRHQARWRAEGHHRRDHQEVRGERLQAGCFEDAPCK